MSSDTVSAPPNRDAFVMRRCTACGATLELPPETVSMTCSYCSSALVDTDRAASSVDRVAPFRIPRPAAQARLREHLADAFWAPEALRKGARRGHVRAHELRGVLVPFHAYTATVRGRYRARVGLHWYRTQTRTHEGKKHRKVVQETEWFPLAGTLVDQLEDHLVCASAGLTARELRLLLPFDLGRAAGFDPRLVVGWEAELPSRTRTDVDRTAVDEIRELEARRLHKWLLPGDAHEVEAFRADVEVHRVHLVLLPVWLATYRQGSRLYRLLVNGQTGRCVGRPPISRVKVSVAAAVFAAIMLLILWTTGVLR